MPWPLSATRISLRPPCSISTMMRVLPASMAFSTSSLTTEAGRSTTSPAAILLERISGRIRILAIDARVFTLGNLFSADIGYTPVVLKLRARYSASMGVRLNFRQAASMSCCRLLAAPHRSSSAIHLTALRKLSPSGWMVVMATFLRARFRAAVF
ncbi:hypothetical protein DESC_740205 [Desulfosarcina cetonica]|nr:hypothetical protein DESC_740205 [Desulfosarcina cetonica]